MKVKSPGKHGIRNSKKAERIRQQLQEIRNERSAKYRLEHPAKEQDLSWVASVPTGLENP